MRTTLISFVAVMAIAGEARADCNAYFAGLIDHSRSNGVVGVTMVTGQANGVSGFLGTGGETSVALRWDGARFRSLGRGGCPGHKGEMLLSNNINNTCGTGRQPYSLTDVSDIEMTIGPAYYNFPSGTPSTDWVATVTNTSTNYQHEIRGRCDNGVFWGWGSPQYVSSIDNNNAGEPAMFIFSFFRSFCLG